MKGRNLERVFILLSAVVFALLFLRLFDELKKDFTEVPQRLGDGSMVNLNSDNPAARINQLLTKEYYLEDAKDIQLITSVLSQKLHTDVNPIDNIGELNKERYSLETETASAQGGESFRKRVKLARALLGFSGRDSVRFEQELRSPPQLPAVTDVGWGSHKITGAINRNGEPASGVLIRLQLILPQDSVYSEEVSEVDNEIFESSGGVERMYVLDSSKHRQLISLSAYARTGSDGKFVFSGLPSGKAFEILPLKPNYEFGASKGVSSLDEDVEFAFYQSPHIIKLFSTKDFNNLKKEKALIVRTPEEFSRWFWIIVGVFFGGFLLLHVIFSVRFPQADQLILPVIMVLTGLSFLTLLSLQDPLRDRFLAKSTVSYFGVGLLGLCLLLFFNLKKFTTDSALYRLLFLKSNKSAAKGWQWAGIAVLLLGLTILFGTGPEGSGVKVNLFGFQPSEVVKFIIIVFLAGFFATNEKFIAEYSSWQKRWSFFSFALIAILTTILLFLILGDLGPAIVACFAFIILFSFSRGDFMFMAGSVLLYILSVWLIKNIWIATAVAVGTVAIITLFLRKQLSESAVMALVVIAGFLLLDQVPFLDKLFPGPIQRLIDRKAIWQDAWNNEVFGGDQVANGIWAMSSGGVTGQGVGEGFAKTIPEAHTDMILPSIGEEFGWAGIVCVFILFLIYLHRAIIIGRHSGTPFLFYLSAGIGVGTFVQFLLIAGGSIGALPLSGVSLPFVSYGGSSLICNLLAAGFLLSTSLVQGTAVQMKYISKQQDRNLVPALLAACISIVLLSVSVGQYLFNNKKWVVQPALVADRSGARMFSYNPRISILMNKLQAGTLYDRTGKILATSKPELLIQKRDSLVTAGLEWPRIQSLSRKRLDRYYPFAQHMFFWTGDMNTGVFMGSTNGYFGEYEHLADLRGFQTPTVNYTVKATRFREDRFLPQSSVEMNVAKRDFSVLAPLLLAGINSAEVEKFKQRNRDVQLSMDAGLQTGIQKALAGDDSLSNKRVSVVIMEDATGDVLTSAAFPLPPVDDWEMLTLTEREKNKLPFWITTRDLGFTYATQPGSTAKIVTTLAAFNKLGDAAARRTFLIRQQDLIRVKSEEPDETGTISLQRALVKSNNPYFIKLANEEQLQEEMGTLYMETGMFLKGVGGYYFENNTNTEQRNKWLDIWRKTEFRSIRSYNKNNIRATRGRGVSGMAWGQGELIATPASVMRAAAAVANKGVLVPHRFVLKISDSSIAAKEGEAIVKQPQHADAVKGYMIEQSANKVARLGLTVAGKTGTPERIYKQQRINDGWYVFFAPKQKGDGHIVVCIRIENTKGSSDAVKLAGKHVIPRLLELGYIKSIDGEKEKKPLAKQQAIRPGNTKSDQDTLIQ